MYVRGSLGTSIPPSLTSGLKDRHRIVRSPGGHSAIHRAVIGTKDTPDEKDTDDHHHPGASFSQGRYVPGGTSNVAGIEFGGVPMTTAISSSGSSSIASRAPAARRIREEHPGAGVLVLSQYVEARHAIQLQRDAPEGVGCLLKDRVSDIGEFVDADRRVARGGSAIDPEVVAHLLKRHGEGSELAALTGREREIIALMAEGRSNQAISERLFLSPKTVETHVGAIFSKLGLFPGADDHRRVLAVLMFLRNT
jgi:DNA-binding NarL/FixJ family response regulator